VTALVAKGIYDHDSERAQAQAGRGRSENLLELRKETKDDDVFTRLSRTISLKRLEIKRLTG
jgi:hypothetical protein